MARNLGIEVTRLNKIINDWVQAKSDEKTKITAYGRGGGRPRTSIAPAAALHE
ncbi:MAG: hypothetical protein ABSF35_15740 [Polyangia bacterium]|jgi:hypothetical protein